MSHLPLLEDACEGLPHTRRAMFGGHGLFAPNGGMFAAIVPGDRIALKLPREEDAAAFLAEGGEAWVYEERMTMRAWFVIPDDFYDEPLRLAEWARRAHATAEPPKAKKPKKAAARKGPSLKRPKGK